MALARYEKYQVTWLEQNFGELITTSWGADSGWSWASIRPNPFTGYVSYIDPKYLTNGATPLSTWVYSGGGDGSWWSKFMRTSAPYYYEGYGGNVVDISYYSGTPANLLITKRLIGIVLSVEGVYPANGYHTDGFWYRKLDDKRILRPHIMSPILIGNVSRSFNS